MTSFNSKNKQSIDATLRSSLRNLSSRIVIEMSLLESARWFNFAIRGIFLRVKTMYTLSRSVIPLAFCYLPCILRSRPCDTPPPYLSKPYTTYPGILKVCTRMSKASFMSLVSLICKHKLNDYHKNVILIALSIWVGQRNLIQYLGFC